MKRAISWILSISMVICIASIPALADNEMELETNIDKMLGEYVGNSQAPKMRETVASDIENLDSIGITPAVISSMRLEDNGKMVYVLKLIPDVSSELIVSEESNGNLTLEITEGNKHDTVLFRNDGKLYINNHEIVTKISNEESGNKVSANARCEQYSETCLYGTPSEYTNFVSYNTVADVEFNQNICSLTYSAIAIALSGFFSLFMPGIGASILGSLAVFLYDLANQYAPLSTCGSYKLWKYEHPDSNSLNRYYKYSGYFYVLSDFTGNSTPYTYYYENFFF